MSENIRFIKFIPSKEAMYLITHKNPAYLNAFRLLTIIAERARRYDGHPDGLKIGQCHLGDWASYGMSEQNYRTAKKILERMGQISIVLTKRSKKKKETYIKNSLKNQDSNVNYSFNSHFCKNPTTQVTTQVTTEGTIVQLCSSTIYDINPNLCDDSSNDSSNVQLTTSQRQTKKEEEKKDIFNNISKEDARRAARPHPKDFLIFNFDKMQFEGISEKDIADWKFIYPHLNLQVEILRAAEWLKSNPSKSRKKNWRKYLTGWFGRTNDSIENKKAYQTAFKSVNQDKRTKDINGNPVENPHKGRF